MREKSRATRYQGGPHITADVAMVWKMVENELMKTSPRVVGFVQAAGLTLYVTVFATLVQHVQNWFLLRDVQPGPIMSIALFLLAFVISALICGSLILGYPLLLFSSGKHHEAMKAVLWSLLWLIVIALCVALISFSFLSRS